MNAKAAADKHARPSAMQRVLDGIERAGNKVPHPALIFLALIFIVIVLSQILSWAGTSVTTEVAEPATVQVAPEYPQGSSVPGNDAPPAPAVPEFEIHHETITAESLLTGDGIRFIFTTAVQNFNDFGVVAVIPIFVPLFYRLGIAPQTVIAAYRVCDGPANVITPLMVYLPFIVLVCQRYRKKAGIGTVVSMMLPYTGIVLVTWTLFYVAWYAIGIPWGPDAPVHR